MRLSIRHRTRYDYQHPVDGGLQLVRLFPAVCDSIEILRWSVRGGKALAGLTPFEDGIGNLAALASVPRGALKDEILVEGEVETTDTDGWMTGLREPLPPSYFLRETNRTAADATITALAMDHDATEAGLEALSEDIGTRIAFTVGATKTETTAVEALALGAGVCQDHAHVLVSAARVLGVPARYVSGYLLTGVNREPASHAWAEVFVEGRGWLALDPANRRRPDAAYVRCAVGLDYAQAAPVTGVRIGGGTESLTVSVDVAAAQQ